MHRLTEKTLLEQMHLTEREIAVRKKLFGFTEQDVQALVSVKEYFRVHVDEVVDEFYAQQVAEPEISLLIGDKDTFDRLHSSMRRYVMSLFEGYYDLDYVNSRLRIGKIHNRIGVKPKLYISAVRLLLSIILKHIFMLTSTEKSCKNCINIQESLVKLLMFDTHFIFDTYINSLIGEINIARQTAESYAQGLEDQVFERTQKLRELSLRDSCTGLLNQRAFYEGLRQQLAASERLGNSLALLYFDLNDFKPVNDREGHLVGDQVLALVGETIRNCIRESDLGCRYGGNEFAIIMPGSSASDALGLFNRLVEKFSTQNHRGVTFSAGAVDNLPLGEISSDEMVKSADAAMYHAKLRAKSEKGHQIEVVASNGLSVKPNGQSNSE